MGKYEVILRYYKAGIVEADSDDEAKYKAHCDDWLEGGKLESDDNDDEAFIIED